MGGRNGQTGSGRREESPGSPLRLLRRIGTDGSILPGSIPEGNEWEICLEFEEVDGRLWPARLVLERGVYNDGLPPGGITARLLHAIKLGALVDAFNAEHLGNRKAEALFFRRAAEPPYRMPPPGNRPGPRGLGEAFYQDVAARYLAARHAEPRRPIARLVRSYPGYSRANVGDWVAKARQKGYLTAPGQGVAGGRGTPKLEEALRAATRTPPRKVRPPRSPARRP